MPQAKKKHYLRQHLTCMYPLLPTMQNANGDLLSQAMEELAERTATGSSR